MVKIAEGDGEYNGELYDDDDVADATMMRIRRSWIPRHLPDTTAYA